MLGRLALLSLLCAPPALAEEPLAPPEGCGAPAPVVDGADVGGDDVDALLARLASPRCDGTRVDAARRIALVLGSGRAATAKVWRAFLDVALGDPSPAVRDAARAAALEALSCEARHPDLLVPLDEVPRLVTLGVPACGVGAPPPPSASVAVADPADGDGEPPLPLDVPPARDDDRRGERPLPPPKQRPRGEHFWVGGAAASEAFPQGPLAGPSILAGWALDPTLTVVSGVSGLLACSLCTGATSSRYDLRLETGLSTTLFPEEDLSPVLRLSLLLVDANLTFGERHAASLQLGAEAAAGVDWVITEELRAFLELGTFLLGEVDAATRRAAGLLPSEPGVPPLLSESFGLSLRAGVALVL